MFTGIIQDVGTLRRMDRAGRGARAVFQTGLDLSGVALGDSIAVNGTCLTAVALGDGTFTADLSQETLERTTLGGLRPGTPVNLEPALRMGDPLGGHLVQGHVDAVARFVGRVSVGEGWDLTFALPDALLGGVILKGSIALDGVSLTVARLDDPHITIAVIPHTTAHTTLGRLEPGQPVNVETDLIGKYVQRLAAKGASAPGGLTLETLEKHGFA